MKKKHLKKSRRHSIYDPIYERKGNDSLDQKKFKNLTIKLRNKTQEKKIQKV